MDHDDGESLMTVSLWRDISWMKNDNWGNKSNMRQSVVFSMEFMRIEAKAPISLTSPAFTTSGHSPNSWHYKGYAVDYRIKGFSLLEMYLLAERFNFGGIGLYPNHTGKDPFMHVDTRPYDPFKKQARWIAVPSPAKGRDWEYIALNQRNILEFVIPKYKAA